MRGKKKLIVLGLLTVLVALAISVNNYIHKGHRNIAEEKIVHALSAEKLSEALRKDGSALPYIDKVIQTNGKITSIEHNNIVIDNSVQVSFQNNEPGLTVASSIIIKGRCVGYDDLLEVVKIDQAIIIKKN